MIDLDKYPDAPRVCVCVCLAKTNWEIVGSTISMTNAVHHTNYIHTHTNMSVFITTHSCSTDCQPNLTDHSIHPLKEKSAHNKDVAGQEKMRGQQSTSYHNFGFPSTDIWCLDFSIPAWHIHKPQKVRSTNKNDEKQYMFELQLSFYISFASSVSLVACFWFVLTIWSIMSHLCGLVLSESELVLLDSTLKKK